MTAHRLLVFSNPVPGQEQAYDEWYTQVHIHDLLKVPGVQTAQRHRSLPELSRSPLAGFVAEYRIATGDIDATIGEIRRRLGTPEMPMSDAFDRASASFIVLEPVGPAQESEAELQPDASVRAVSFVLSNPVAGREDEYAAWYDGTHIPDLLRVPGYRRGQRFKVLDGTSRNARHAYVARYELRSRDLPETMATARARLGTPEMAMNDSFDMRTASFNLTAALTERFGAGA